MTIRSLSDAVTSTWPRWVPVAGLAALWLHPERADNIALALTGAILVGCILAAVHHGEVVAHRVGEPFGSLILAGAVTIIEASLILSMMLSGSANPALPRDTVFAAIMLILNGVVGGCLLVGGIRHGEQRFVLEGVNAALCVLAAMATLVLVLPGITSSAGAHRYSAPQLIFTAIVSTLLYATFVFVQTVRHRDYFLPEGVDALAGDAHAAPPSARRAAASLGVLLVALIGVVLLAKTLAKPLETAIAAALLPRALVGVAIAALVLAPESLAAQPPADQSQSRAGIGARHDRAHDPDGRDRGARHGLAAVARPRRQKHDIARAVARRRDPVVRNRPNDDLAGRGASSAAGRLYLHHGLSLIGGPVSRGRGQPAGGGGRDIGRARPAPLPLTAVQTMPTLRAHRTENI